jgi:hypothetical protein
MMVMPIAMQLLASAQETSELKGPNPKFRGSERKAQVCPSSFDVKTNPVASVPRKIPEYPAATQDWSLGQARETTVPETGTDVDDHDAPPSPVRTIDVSMLGDRTPVDCSTPTHTAADRQARALSTSFPDMATTPHWWPPLIVTAKAGCLSWVPPTAHTCSLEHDSCEVGRKPVGIGSTDQVVPKSDDT